MGGKTDKHTNGLTEIVKQIEMKKDKLMRDNMEKQRGRVDIYMNTKERDRQGGQRDKKRRMNGRQIDKYT